MVRDFAFVIDEKYSSGEIVSFVKKIDNELIKNVKIFDVFDIKNDALRTLNEIGIDISKIAVSNKSKKW